MNPIQTNSKSMQGKLLLSHEIPGSRFLFKLLDFTGEILDSGKFGCTLRLFVLQNLSLPLLTCIRSDIFTVDNRLLATIKIACNNMSQIFKTSIQNNFFFFMQHRCIYIAITVAEITHLTFRTTFRTI